MGKEYGRCPAVRAVRAVHEHFWSILNNESCWPRLFKLVPVVAQRNTVCTRLYGEYIGEIAG